MTMTNEQKLNYMRTTSLQPHDALIHQAYALCEESGGCIDGTDESWMLECILKELESRTHMGGV